METNELVFISSDAIGRLIDNYPAHVDFSGRLWEITLVRYNPKTGIMIAKGDCMFFHIWRDPEPLFDDQYRVASFLLEGADPEFDKPHPRRTLRSRAWQALTYRGTLKAAALLVAASIVAAATYFCLGPGFLRIFTWLSWLSHRR